MTDENVKDPQKPSGPVTSKNWTVEIDRNLCIGAGTCAALAPKSFILDDQAKAVILKSIDEETQDIILAAAKGCPVEAIIIKDEKGNKIYPV